MLRVAGMLLALFGLACGGRSKSEPRPVTEAVGLVDIGSCAELERFIEDRAVEEMQAELELIAQPGFEVSLPPTSAVIPTRLVPHRGGTPVAPDRVLAHGDRMYLVGAGLLRSVRIEPLGQAVATPIDGDPRALLMLGDHLFAVTEHGGTVQISVLDPDNLRALARTEVPGDLLDVRGDGDDLRLLLRGGFTPAPASPTSRLEAIENADALAAEREVQIRGRDLTDWIPGDIDCSRFAATNGSVRLGLTRLVRIRYRGVLEIDATSLIGRADAAGFGDDGTALVALPHWWAIPRPGQRAHTYLFTFDDQHAPLAAGGLEGRLSSSNAVEVLADRVQAVVAEELRVPDITSTWGRIDRNLRVLDLERTGARLEQRRQSLSFGGASALRAVHFDGPRVIVSSGEATFVLDLDAPESPPKHVALPGALAQVESMGGGLLSLLVRDGGTEIAVVDLGSNGRVDAKTLPAPALFGGLAVDFDRDRGVVAVPAPISGGPLASPGGLEVRLFSLEDTGELHLDATVDFAALHEGLAASPRLLRTLFLEDRILTVSDAGVQVLTLDEASAPLATLSFF